MYRMCPVPCALWRRHAQRSSRIQAPPECQRGNPRESTVRLKDFHATDLRHHAYCSPERVNVDLVRALAVNVDGPRVRVVEPVQQPDNGRFPVKPNMYPQRQVGKLARTSTAWAPDPPLYGTPRQRARSGHGSSQAVHMARRVIQPNEAEIRLHMCGTLTMEHTQNPLNPKP